MPVRSAAIAMTAMKPPAAHSPNSRDRLVSPLWMDTWPSCPVILHPTRRIHCHSAAQLQVAPVYGVVIGRKPRVLITAEGNVSAFAWCLNLSSLAYRSSLPVEGIVHPPACVLPMQGDCRTGMRFRHSARVRLGNHLTLRIHHVARTLDDYAGKAQDAAE